VDWPQESLAVQPALIVPTLIAFGSTRTSKPLGFNCSSRLELGAQQSESRTEGFDNDLGLKTSNIRADLGVQFAHMRYEQHDKLVVGASDSKVWRPKLDAGEERIRVSVGDGGELVTIKGHGDNLTL